MNVVFDRSFSRSLDKIKDKRIRQKLLRIILDLEAAESPGEIRNLEKLSGFKNYYRIRMGDYRLGIEMESGDTIRLVLIAQRKDIYRHFPK